MLQLNNLTGFGVADTKLSFRSADSVTVLDHTTMSFNIVTNKGATLALSGDDAALFEIVNAGTVQTTHVLRWLSDGTPSMDPPGDANSDNVYDITVTATSGSQTKTQDIAVTVELNWRTNLAFDLGLTMPDRFGMNLRMTYDSLIVQDPSDGTKARVRVKAGSAGDVNIGNLYLGEQATTGNAYDMKSSPAPVQLKVGGSGSFTIPAGTSVDTDAVDLTIDETKSYVIAAYFNSTAYPAYRTGFPSSVGAYILSGTDEAGSAVASSGYIVQTAGTVILLDRIQSAVP